MTQQKTYKTRENAEIAAKALLVDHPYVIVALSDGRFQPFFMAQEQQEAICIAWLGFPASQGVFPMCFHERSRKV